MFPQAIVLSDCLELLQWREMSRARCTPGARHFDARRQIACEVSSLIQRALPPPIAGSNHAVKGQVLPGSRLGLDLLTTSTVWVSRPGTEVSLQSAATSYYVTGRFGLGVFVCPFCMVLPCVATVSPSE